jgi:ADP-ribose pyrophosphatase YjhB (NUDIX family)
MSLRDYERPSLTTDMVLFRINETESDNMRKGSNKKLQVLLIQRSIEPQMGKWSLPGGFVEIDEEIEDNVKRKLREKTGISGNFYVEQLYTWGNVNRDERGRVISVSYLGLVNDTTYENAGGSACQEWVDIDDAMDVDLAFDHKNIINYAIQRIQGKAEYTDILFNLMPEEFTIKDCQDVYELMLDKKMDNFKRRISKYLKPLNKMRTGKQFRPAELYTWNREVD